MDAFGKPHKYLGAEDCDISSLLHPVPCFTLKRLQIMMVKRKRVKVITLEAKKPTKVNG